MNKETIELVKKMVEDGNLPQEVAIKYCPEIEKIEDEKIREHIISILKHLPYSPNSVADIARNKDIAWLEKQCEQKSTDRYKEWYDFIRWFVKQRTNNYTLIPSDDDIHKWGDNILNHARKVLEQKSASWSEEDEDAIGMAIIALEDMYDPDEPNNTYAGYTIPFNKAALRLRAIKERCTWKPSDEQIKALEMAIDEQKEEYGFTSLDSLLKQLKKLREE